MLEKAYGHGVMPVAKAAIFVLFLNYYSIPCITGSLISGLSPVCYLLMAMSFYSDYRAHGKRSLVMPEDYKWWLAYIFVSYLLLSLAYSPTATFNALLTYAQRLFLTFIVLHIAIREGSVRFPLTLMSGICICSAIAILPNIGSVSDRLDLSSGYGMSSNDAGALMVYGLFTVLYFMDTKNTSDMIKAILKTALIVLFVAVMFAAGSRKALIGALILFALLILIGGHAGKKNEHGGPAGILDYGCCCDFFSKYLSSRHPIRLFALLENFWAQGGYYGCIR